MPLSNHYLFGGSAGFGDPERVSQSSFESWTDQSATYSTWTYNGYDHANGNVLTLASPGSNQFAEHNTYKSGGFEGHSFVQYSFHGYAWGLAALFNTSTSAEASGTYLETVTSTYTIFRKHPADYTYFNFYADGSNNPIITTAYGTGSGYNESGGQVTLAAGQFKSYTDSNPFYVRTGRDENDFLYVQGFYAGGNSAPDLAGTGFTVTDKYYLNTSTSTFSTSSTGARTLSDAIQFGWGNYDGGTPEQHRHVEFWTAGP